MSDHRPQSNYLSPENYLDMEAIERIYELVWD